MPLFIQSSFLELQVYEIATLFQALYCINQHQQEQNQEINEFVVRNCQKTIATLLQHFEEQVRQYYLIESMAFQLRALMKLQKLRKDLYTTAFFKQLICLKQVDHLSTLFALINSQKLRIEEHGKDFQFFNLILEVFTINIVLDRVKPEWQKVETLKKHVAKIQTKS